MVSDGGDSRRKFLGRTTVAIGGALTVVIGVPLGRFALFPLRRTVVSSMAEPVDVIGEGELKAGGAPVQVQIFSSALRDGWSLAGGVPLGSAYVRKTGDGQVVAFSSVCPHLGCAIHYEEPGDKFGCPCHRSMFAADGQKLSGPARRGLDSLPVVIESGRVKVTFARFRPDIADKVEV